MILFQILFYLLMNDLYADSEERCREKTFNNEKIKCSANSISGGANIAYNTCCEELKIFGELEEPSKEFQLELKKSVGEYALDKASIIFNDISFAREFAIEQGMPEEFINKAFDLGNVELQKCNIQKNIEDSHCGEEDNPQAKAELKKKALEMFGVKSLSQIRDKIHQRVIDKGYAKKHSEKMICPSEKENRKVELLKNFTPEKIVVFKDAIVNMKDDTIECLEGRNTKCIDQENAKENWKSYNTQERFRVYSSSSISLKKLDSMIPLFSNLLANKGSLKKFQERLRKTDDSKLSFLNAMYGDPETLKVTSTSICNNSLDQIRDLICNGVSTKNIPTKTFIMNPILIKDNELKDNAYVSLKNICDSNKKGNVCEGVKDTQKPGGLCLGNYLNELEKAGVSQNTAQQSDEVKSLEVCLRRSCQNPDEILNRLGTKKRNIQRYIKQSKKGLKCEPLDQKLSNFELAQNLGCLDSSKESAAICEYEDFKVLYKHEESIFKASGAQGLAGEAKKKDLNDIFFGDPEKVLSEQEQTAVAESLKAEREGVEVVGSKNYFEDESKINSPKNVPPKLVAPTPLVAPAPTPVKATLTDNGREAGAIAAAGKAIGNVVSTLGDAIKGFFGKKDKVGEAESARADIGREEDSVSGPGGFSANNIRPFSGPRRNDPQSNTPKDFIPIGQDRGIITPSTAGVVNSTEDSEDQAVEEKAQASSGPGASGTGGRANSDTLSLSAKGAGGRAISGYDGGPVNINPDGVVVQTGYLPFNPSLETALADISEDQNLKVSKDGITIIVDEKDAAFNLENYLKQKNIVLGKSSTITIAVRKAKTVKGIDQKVDFTRDMNDYDVVVLTPVIHPEGNYLMYQYPVEKKDLLKSHVVMDKVKYLAPSKASRSYSSK